MLVSVCHDCILQVNMALIHDAVQLFARTLRRLDSATVDIKPLECKSQTVGGHGASLINFIKDVSKMVATQFRVAVYNTICTLAFSWFIQL
jgi:hypothetical protein